MRKYLLPENGNFYKANLHCHSTVSDGVLTPEELKKAYMDKGYSIIAYTDHDIMIDHSDLTDENFLALRSYEMQINEKRTDEEKKIRPPKTCHICMIALDLSVENQVCWNSQKRLHGNLEKYRDQVKYDKSLPDYKNEYTPECINDMIRLCREGGFFVTYNHPAWSMEYAEDYLKYEGMNAMEICNFSSYAIGWDDYVPYIYDEILRSGKRIYCIAADDNHNDTGDNWAYDSFGGFTVIKADKLEYRTVTKAMEDGNMYASQGPEIYDLYVEDGKVYIKCSPARRIVLSTGKRYSRCVWANIGDHFGEGSEKTITEASFDIPEDCHYIRLTVIDMEGRPANTRAYFLDEIN